MLRYFKKDYVDNLPPRDARSQVAGVVPFYRIPKLAFVLFQFYSRRPNNISRASRRQVASVVSYIHSLYSAGCVGVAAMGIGALYVQFQRHVV
jgi:hypothetical protein